ncbi:MAG: hypothetical protein WCC48_05395 [Anaeromyxobacteraceae bacterium]
MGVKWLAGEAKRSCGRMLVAGLLIAGCGGRDASANGPAAAPAPAPAAAPVAAQKPADDPRVKCPPGTTQQVYDPVETAFPRLTIWCVDAEGYRQGPEMTWKKDKATGELWLASEHNYKDGREEGVQRAWYRNGVKEIETYAVNGRDNGIARAWHPNSHLAYQCESRNGVAVGIGRWWDEKGRLTDTRDFAKRPMMNLSTDDEPSPEAK